MKSNFFNTELMKAIRMLDIPNVYKELLFQYWGLNNNEIFNKGASVRELSDAYGFNRSWIQVMKQDCAKKIKYAGLKDIIHGQYNTPAAAILFYLQQLSGPVWDPVEYTKTIEENVSKQKRIVTLCLYLANNYREYEALLAKESS